MKSKKQALILAGNSKKNIYWIKKMEELYSVNYDVTSIKYDNWYNNERINLDKEIKKLIAKVESKNIEIVVAKSIGMLLATKIITQNIIKPKLIIYMGYPFKFFKEEKINILDEILELRKNFKILFIQQTQDPQCYAESFEKMTNNVIPIISINGNDHAYNKFITIKKYIDEFIKLNDNSEFEVIKKDDIKK